MKTTILSAAFAIAALTLQSFSDPGKKVASATKDIQLSGFKKLYVGRNVTVVLVPAFETTKATVVGDAASIGQVSISQSGEEMRVWSSKNLYGKKVIVYIPVSNLTYLELGSGAKVSSHGPLFCPKLDVFIHEESRLDIKNLGQVEVSSAANCEFVYLDR